MAVNAEFQEAELKKIFRDALGRACRLSRGTNFELLSRPLMSELGGGRKDLFHLLQT